MTKKSSKTPILNAEERFFLNLDDELTTDVEFEGFTFTLKVPDMMSEAALSLGALQAAQHILSRPEYEDTLKLVKFPKLTTVPNEKGDGEEVKVEEQDIDLNKLPHVRYAVSNMTEQFVSTVNDVAYVNIIVKEISYGGKPVWVTVDGEDIHIETFFDFVKHVRARKLRLTRVINTITTSYLSWLEAIEVDPQEVKN